MSCSCLVLRIQYPWMDPVGEYLCLQLIDGWGLTPDAVIVLPEVCECVKHYYPRSLLRFAQFMVCQSSAFQLPHFFFFLLPRSSRLPFTLPPMSAEEQHPLEHGTSQRRSVGDEMASATSRVGWERGRRTAEVYARRMQEARPVRPAVSAY